MSGRARFPGYFAAMIAVAFSVLVLVTGCQKDKPMVSGKATHEKASPAAASPAGSQATNAVAQQAAGVAEQTTCPVMGGAIDKNIFVEYKGKKVYFCCNGCPAAFQADPEKYVSKLPQFAR